MGAVRTFSKMDPGLSGMGALTNSRNWKDPGYAFNPMKSGSVANAGLNVIAPGLGLVAGKGSGDSGSAYANNQMDLQTYGARKYLTDFMKTSQADQKRAYKDAVQRGIENRTNAKLLENSRLIGPKLDASEVKSVPAFLRSGERGPLMYSGADRGTDYGKALDAAMKKGETTTGEIENKLGAKGSSRGLANEAIPKFVSSYSNNFLTPEAQLNAQAQMQAQAMNNATKGGK